MNREKKKNIKNILLICICLYTYSSYGQDKLLEGVKTGFDTVIKGIHQIGSYADEVLRSNLFGNEQSVPYTITKKYENQITVAQNANVLVKNEFGFVDIKSWSEPLVLIETTLTLGGQSQDILEKTVNSFQPRITNENNTLIIENQFPEETVSFIKIDYVITLPRSTNVSVDNFFGDTRVFNIDGTVTINEQYGSVELENINGRVSVRTQGEFPLKAKKIMNGGFFYLSRTNAEIDNLQGEVSIYNLLGELKLQKMGSGKYVLHTDSGKTSIKIEDTSGLEIKGSLLGSQLTTDLTILQKKSGSLITMDLTNPDAKQKIEMTGIFSEISIFRSDTLLTSPQSTISNYKPFSEVLSSEEEISSGDAIIINNQKGDVRILSADDNKIRVKATRLVWVSSADKATSALEKISVNLHRTENRIYIMSSGNFDGLPEYLSDWRVDIQVFCPPSIDISIESKEGQTACENIDSSLRINQGSGVVSILKCKGPYFVSNQKGNIRIEDTSNDGEITIRGGLATLKNIKSPINITAIQANINLEEIQSKVIARIQEGDIRFLALNGLSGDVDISSEKGNISILLSPETDCKIKVISEEGIIDTAIPLTGVFSRSKQEAFAQIREGKYSVQLKAVKGDIIIDGNIEASLIVNTETIPSEGIQQNQ